MKAAELHRRRLGSAARAAAGMACLVFGIAFAFDAAAQHALVSSGLAYDAQTQGPVPIPPSERALQTAVAERWFQVSKDGITLEGVIFDAGGNLLFCDMSGRRVLRLSPDKLLSTVVTLNDLSPNGLALHKDGRLFIAALRRGSFDRGAILAVNADGSGLETIVPPLAGYVPNDLVFDARGGLYFTDFQGTATEPLGGVYYVSPDFATIKPVLPRLALANGVALSPDGRWLWATEFGRNLLHRIQLADASTIAPIRSAVAYHFVGPAPDSLRVDADGNVYVEIAYQGRVLVFNRNGLPIGQVLLPGRDSGHNLHSSSLAIDPGRNDAYIVSNDGDGGQGAAVFRAKVFSKGLPPAPSQ